MAWKNTSNSFVEVQNCRNVQLVFSIDRSSFVFKRQLERLDITEQRENGKSNAVSVSGVLSMLLMQI